MISLTTPNIMFAKCIVLTALVAYASAGLIAGPAYAATSYAAPAYAGVVAPSIGASHQSTLRSWDGSAAISQYSKAVDSAFSSVRKSDVRITNDAKVLAPAVTYGAPAYAAYAAPAAYAAHAAYAAPVARAGLVGVAYSAAPTVAHISYDSPIAHYAW